MKINLRFGAELLFLIMIVALSIRGAGNDYASFFQSPFFSTNISVLISSHARILLNDLKGLYSSFWPILYLALIFMIGHIAIKKWGGFIASVCFILCLSLIKVSLPGNYATALQLLSLSPVSLIGNLLDWSKQAYGNAGWGILYLGLFIPVLTLPLRQESGMLFLSHRAKKVTPTQTVASLVNVILLIVTGIALWIVLYRYKLAGISLPFLGIPTLTLPNGSPVWELPYMVAVLMGLSSIIILNKVNLNISGGQPIVTTGSIIFYSIIIGLFAPAGLFLFVLCSNIVKIILAPLINKPDDRGSL